MGDVEKRLTLEKDRLTLENAVNATRAQVIGGVLVFFTAFTAWRNLKVAEEKQVTERFSKAAEHLGNANEYVRLGAIYALERIANDSDKDYQQIIEILTAYVRGRAQLSGQKWSQEAFLPIDIQAVLTVLGRRKRVLENLGKYRLRLEQTNLRNADLIDAKLQGVFFTIAHLEGSLLNRADLENATLVGANLTEANLYGADLTRADLTRAFLLSTDLRKATLASTQLEGALLCNVALPESFPDKDTLKDRDCDRLPQELLKLFPQVFKDIEDAKQYVDKARQWKWE